MDLRFDHNFCFHTSIYWLVGIESTMPGNLTIKKNNPTLFFFFYSSCQGMGKQLPTVPEHIQKAASFHTPIISCSHIFHFQKKKKEKRNNNTIKLHNTHGRAHLSHGPHPHLISITTCPLLLPLIITRHYLSQAVFIATSIPPWIHIHRNACAYTHAYIPIAHHDIIPNPSTLLTIYSITLFLKILYMIHIF